MGCLALSEYHGIIVELYDGISHSKNLMELYDMKQQSQLKNVMVSYWGSHGITSDEITEKDHQIPEKYVDLLIPICSI